jgi:hypothetical protein
MVAKAIAHRNQSLSSKFFCIMSLGAVHHPDPRAKRHIGKSTNSVFVPNAAAQTSMRRRTLLVRRTQLNFASRRPISCPGTMSDLRHYTFQILNPEDG